jgi:hypothetical protein
MIYFAGVFLVFYCLSGVCTTVVKSSQPKEMASCSCTRHTKTCAQFEEHSIPSEGSGERSDSAADASRS